MAQLAGQPAPAASAMPPPITPSPTNPTLATEQADA
jgi:hypothetical protein